MYLTATKEKRYRKVQQVGGISPLPHFEENESCTDRSYESRNEKWESEDILFFFGLVVSDVWNMIENTIS